MKIDDQVKVCGVKPARESEIVVPSRQAAWPPGNDEVVELRMVTDDGFGWSLDEIREMRVGKPAPQRANRGRGEYHVANQPQPDEQDSQGSIVASSISITGMSSLIGYTR